MRPQSVLAILSASLGSCQNVCDSKCQEVFKTIVAVDGRQWATADVTNDPFYDPPTNLTGAKPGDLLRWEDLSSQRLAVNFTQVPMGMSLSRFIYVTEDKDRKPIPSSAYALLPYSIPTGQDKFRTIAWAHGTSGNARKCAPSNNNRLWENWSAPFLYTSQGYAVIASDYAGQGVAVPTTFQYEAGHLHVADVAYSVVAVRSIIGHLLSEEWVVSGHSEGGMTA